MQLAQLFLAGIGFVILIISASSLIAPYIGWSHKYDASIIEERVDIKKIGRYSINVRRDRGWLIRGHGSLSNAFPKVSFSVTKIDSKEMILYVPALSLLSNKGGRTITIRVGYFDVLSSGMYLITSLPSSQFLKKEEIVIRKYVSAGKQVLSIIGASIGGMMFIFGILLFTGNM